MKEQVSKKGSAVGFHGHGLSIEKDVFQTYMLQICSQTDHLEQFQLG